MGNGEFEVQHNIRQQWQQTCRGVGRYYTNKITGQQFQFKVLSKFQQSPNISQLIQRSIYPLPKTPKIIILNDQRGQLCILIQQFHASLAVGISSLMLRHDLLQKILQASLTIYSLVRKFGPFAIKQELLGFNRSGEIICWINQAKQNNQVEYSFGKWELHQEIMIGQILDIFRSRAKMEVSANLCEMNRHSFVSFIQNLEELIRQQKINILKSQDRNTKQHYEANRPTIYAKNVRSMKNLHHHISPQIQNKEVSNKKRVSIPHFIKDKKQKKLGLLERLSHRRTSTKDLAMESGSSLVVNSKRYLQGNIKQLEAPSFIIKRVKSLDSSTQHTKNQCSNFSNQTFSKISSYPSTVCTNLTSSRESNTVNLKKYQFNPQNQPKLDKNVSKKIQKNSNAVYKNLSCFRSKQNSQNMSCFRSKQNSQKVEAKDVHPNQKSLVSLCSQTFESKYFNQPEKLLIIREIEEQSHFQSKTIEEELGQLLTNQPTSMRNTFERRCYIDCLDEEFGRLINY